MITTTELFQPFRDPSPAQVGNMIECPFWMVVGLAAWAYPRWWSRQPEGSAPKRVRLLALIVFVIFGASDGVEVYTGAWWRPWWLLAWKAACILALLILLRRWRRLSRPTALQQ